MTCIVLPMSYMFHSKPPLIARKLCKTQRIKLFCLLVCRFLRKASLTADTMPELLHLRRATAEEDAPDEEADAPDEEAATPDSEAVEQPRPISPEASQKLPPLRLNSAESSPGISPVRYTPGDRDISRQSTMWSLSPNLDFEEFLERQRTFVQACLSTRSLLITLLYRSTSCP